MAKSKKKKKATRPRGKKKAKKAATRAGSKARGKSAAKKPRKQKSARNKPGKGKVGALKSKDVNIWYENGIKVSRDHVDCKKNSEEVKWVGDDTDPSYVYRVEFKTNGTPFAQDTFEPISKTQNQKSGNPVVEPGLKHYKYTVVLVGSSEKLDPTIKVDP